MADNKSLFPTFAPCFFCRNKVYVAGCLYMFQGQPVCPACTSAKTYVAVLCTRNEKYTGIDVNWRKKMLAAMGRGNVKARP